VFLQRLWWRLPGSAFRQRLFPHAIQQLRVILALCASLFNSDIELRTCEVRVYVCVALVLWVAGGIFDELFQVCWTRTCLLDSVDELFPDAMQQLNVCLDVPDNSE